MNSEAGIQNTKTNHSLRATGAPELFQVGLPEKTIKEHCSHCSPCEPMNKQHQNNT